MCRDLIHTAHDGFKVNVTIDYISRKFN
jgi:hypothetical protein